MGWPTEPGTVDQSVSTIDWSFIASPDIEGESTHLTGYVPSDTSGFTVGSLDVGQHSKEDLRTMLQRYANKLAPDRPYGNIRGDLLHKISPFAKGSSDPVTYGTLQTRNLVAGRVKFEKEDIEYLTGAKRYEFEVKIAKQEGWDKLDTKTKTILASIGWQYGLGSAAFKKAYKTRGDKVDLANLLDEFGEREYQHRRTSETDYLLSPVDKVFRDMTKDDNFLE